MGLFQRKSRKGVPSGTDSGAPAPFTEIVASQADGSTSFTLLAPETGEAAPFPAIELVLRRSEDLQPTLEALRAAGAGEADVPVSENVVLDLVALLGLDEGERFSHLSENSLAALRLTPEIARAGALARLRLASDQLQIEGGDGRFRATYPDNPDLAASFMLVADTWLNTDALSGDAVFAVGSRVMLYVCGSEDEESIAGLRELAAVLYDESVEDPMANGRPLTPKLLVLREGVLQELDG